VNLDLADIQGNLLTAYGKLGFPKGRVLLFHLSTPAAGRAFIERLRPLVTTALRWPSGKGVKTGAVSVQRPEATLNLAFTFRGLLALETPIRTLRGMPDEFIDGMAARAHVLGDDFPPDSPTRWDEVWRPGVPGREPHLLVLLNAQADAQGQALPALDRLTAVIKDTAASLDGQVVLLRGHGSDAADAQELSARFEPDGAGGWRPTPTEHFGYTDAISDPVFHGQLPEGGAYERAEGGGKLDRRGRWTPLATGEFLLGYPDEAQEIAGAAMPLSFSRNGTFFAYRKLHQNVAAFEAALEAAAVGFAAAAGIDDLADAKLLLKAKIAGRWPDGAPVESAPTLAEWRRSSARFSSDRLALNSFTYGGDPDGARCPMTAHIRRMNPRDALDPLGPTKPGGAAGSALNNRRRILRRGLPYGAVTAGTAADERGIVLLAVCASLFRQFEFVQQQWVNYGLDFNAGNQTDPLVGNHGPGAAFVVPSGPGGQPYILSNLPQFVEVRGGDYFFAPSLTALRMIGQGLVDPT
jgi:Dyp-type peroxidase family